MDGSTPTRTPLISVYLSTFTVLPATSHASQRPSTQVTSEGGLRNLIQGTISRKYARLVEQMAFFGNSAIATLAPGLFGETGLRSFAAEATLADYDDFSKAVEMVRNKNASRLRSSRIRASRAPTRA